MKRTLLSLFALVIASAAFVSCSFDDTGTTTKLTVYGTFDYLPDSEYAQYFQKDSTYSMSYLPISDLCYSRAVTNEADGTFKGGFNISMKKGKVDLNGEVTPFASAGTGGGYNESSTYAVWYQNPDASQVPDYSIIFSISQASTSVCNLLGACVNNSAIVEDFFHSGKAQEGDYLKVKVTGYRKGQASGSLEFTLMDLTGKEPVFVDSWTEWDMTELTSNIDSVKFEVLTSRPEVPPYFCMDSFCAYIELEY